MPPILGGKAARQGSVLERYKQTEVPFPVRPRLICCNWAMACGFCIICCTWNSELPRQEPKDCNKDILTPSNVNMYN